MAFTRFYDDPSRVMKKLQESTEEGFYHMNVPGNGVSMPFVTDPNIRLQMWGANRHQQLVAIESELKGISSKLSRNQKPNVATPRPLQYSTYDSEISSTSRAVMPAWELRDAETIRWDPTGRPAVPIHQPFESSEWTRKLKVERTI